MVIKLKNWTSHWSFKLFVILLLLTSFLGMVTVSYDKIKSGEMALLLTDFRHSDSYYDLVDPYYNQVFDSYLDGFAYLAPERRTQLDAISDQYYLVVTNDGQVYSNLPDVKNYMEQTKAKTKSQQGFGMSEVNDMLDLFYRSPLIGDIYSVTGESEPIFGETATYLTKRTHDNEQVYLGFSPKLIEQAQAKFDALKGTTHELYFSQLVIGTLLILLCLVLLAVVSGKSPTAMGIHLNAMDWLYFDCLLLLWLLVEMALVGLSSELINYMGNFAIKPLLLASAAISTFMAIWAWMSFWKRIKSRTLLQHTLLAWCWQRTLGWLLKKLRLALHTLQTGPIYGYSLLIMSGFAAANLFSLFLMVLFVNGLGFPGLVLGLAIYGLPLVSLFVYFVHNDQQLAAAISGLSRIQQGDLSQKLSLKGSHMFQNLAGGINNLSEALDNAVHKALQSERMKTELITNVSHDLKTPLTSIMTYVDLLKREGLDSPEAGHYLDVLDQKSEQLKKLTLDLFDAAKAASGSLPVTLETLHTFDFMNQLLGEYEDQLLEAKLQLVMQMEAVPESICADGRHLWRIFDNLLGNIIKYAAPNSRVYLSVLEANGGVSICLKNISHTPLNMPAEALLERFKRGDESRSSEGSGLGLSIALSLCELQGGHLSLAIDGDLFKATVWLPSHCQQNAPRV